jgi:hypothetical protein
MSVSLARAHFNAGSAIKVDLNRTRNPEERHTLQSAENLRAFPYLEEEFEVLAPATPTYNCIAHTLGFHDRWIDPQLGPADNRLLFMDQLYAPQGYRRAAHLDWRTEQGSQKIVVYGLSSQGAITKITHAAIQARNGAWSSKLGRLALIGHVTPQAVRGPEYGVPVAVYVRPAPWQRPAASPGSLAR